MPSNADSPSSGPGLQPVWTTLRSPYVFWIGGAILLTLLVHLGIKWQQASAPVRIEYSTFLEHVESGYVERVEIVNGKRINGTYTAAAVQNDRVETRPPPAAPMGAVVDRSRRAFATHKPTAHELTAFLRRHNEAATGTDTAPVTFAATQESDWVGTLLLWGLPLGLIVGLWFFFMRRMATGGREEQIGSDTAALFEEAGGRRVTFDDVAGLAEPKEEVAEVVEFLRRPQKFTRLGGALPTGVLLVGPPGTGKTLLAKAVAGEAGVPFASISGSDFMEMFVGVGASRVRDLFDQAKERAPCIIFIDEVDAIGRTRGGPGGAGTEERDNTLNQLLVEMDGFDSDEGVVIMAATNRPDVLDAALLRPGRFDRQISIHKPDRLERADIFRVHVADLRLDASVDPEALARQTPGFAGAEIANVCNEAALLAARRGRNAVQMDDFDQALDRVMAGLERSNKLISPEERRVIAHHESGHAIVGWFLEHTDPVVKVSVVPRGLSALGHAQHLPKERDLYSREALMDRMTMALGGRGAEEIVFGRATTGAKDDLERVTETAYAMVVDYGMSDRIGPLSYNRAERRADGPLFEKPYSDAMAAAIDEEVADIVGEARARANDLLREKRPLLDEMAERLLREEVLGVEALVALLGPPPHGEYAWLKEGDGTSRNSASAEGASPSSQG
ncbi:cell division protease FtsH [Salinibacter ruber]|uniref:ATP-dependent zinc metalloprotease FtsH n=1 Tax=Salinibacter ruber TaxID=146919 RepID=A0AAW5P2Y9_9BACT|nr:ATP-dependent zinc metalloprotease FtsH [Salinibacter ruber]MCS3665374.1 cell division protease FtsH [Salinibacter ruber]MCS4156074.1 cell division protease FtsH [Salinibacter ruber]MCS4223544.1 cell division protease FtsH [Salinibacter ruber]